MHTLLQTCVCRTMASILAAQSCVFGGAHREALEGLKWVSKVPAFQARRGGDDMGTLKHGVHVVLGAKFRAGCQRRQVDALHDITLLVLKDSTQTLCTQPLTEQPHSLWK